MDKKELVCIRCPLGCMITATVKEEGDFDITGNTCPRGAEYAKKELTAPTRTVTSTVRVKGGKKSVVSVKTQTDIPKNKIMDCMAALKNIEMEAPIAIGDIVVENIVGTGVNIVATNHVEMAI